MSSQSDMARNSHLNETILKTRLLKAMAPSAATTEGWLSNKSSAPGPAGATLLVPCCCCCCLVLRLQKNKNLLLPLLEASTACVFDLCMLCASV